MDNYSLDNLDRLRRKLSDVPEVVATVTFRRTDGRSVSFDNVNVDSVGPSAESPGVVGVEFTDDRAPVHVPFVESWTFDYR